MGRTPTLASGTPPGQSPVTTLHSPGSVHSHGSSAPEGYELCNGCIESVGVVHALEAGAAATSLTSPSLGADHGHGGHTLGHGVSPSDSHRSFSEWKRTAPRLKGQLRHAYLEQLLGPDGWQTISTSSLSPAADPPSPRWANYSLAFSLLLSRTHLFVFLS
jgi:hypothetical protein